MSDTFLRKGNNFESETSPKKVKRLPGDEVIWVFLLGDMTVFSCVFIMFAYYKAASTDIFLQSQAELSIAAGSINMLLLLTSSLFVILALKSARKSSVNLSSKLLAAATLCGAGFLAVKAFEFYEKTSQGITFLTNDFYTFYFLITGIHFAHVVVGVAVLMYFSIAIRKQRMDEKNINILESVGSYWHMTDLLWVLIFPIIYLLP